MHKSGEFWAVALAALLMALPLWFLLRCAGGLNDKPHGWHPVPSSYGMTGLAAIAAAVVAWGLARQVSRSERFAVFYWLIAGLIGCALLLTFCLWWGRWVQEYRDRNGRPTDPPSEFYSG
jgi:hypothetical protein